MKLSAQRSRLVASIRAARLARAAERQALAAMRHTRIAQVRAQVRQHLVITQQRRRERSQMRSKGTG